VRKHKCGCLGRPTSVATQVRRSFSIEGSPFCTAQPTAAASDAKGPILASTQEVISWKNRQVEREALLRMAAQWDRSAERKARKESERMQDRLSQRFVRTVLIPRGLS
jgi:hypothetical protein